MSRLRIVVVGAGVSGLAAATALRGAAPGLEVVVLEARARVGGLVDTEQAAGGFIIEHGAECLVTAKLHGSAVLRAAGVDDAIVVGTGPRRTFAATPGGLVPMPALFAGLGARTALDLARSPLLSFSGKARAALEPLVPRRADRRDESVRAFAGRRFGAELARVLVEPMIGTFYGGDTTGLSAEACVPRLRTFEREHGSVTRGLWRAQRAARLRALPPVVSLRAGMGSLPEGLARRLGDRVVRGVAATRIRRLAAGKFRVETRCGSIVCDGVVLATPAWEASALVEELSPEIAAGLAAVRHTGLEVVTFAWPRHEVLHPLDGTGWVRAWNDPRPTVACTWSSRKWPGRAPAGFVLFRSVLAHTDAGEPELIAAARGDLRDLIGVESAPRLIRVRRLARATPIYETGHLDRMACVAATECGAFALAGNAHSGIGVPDCLASGEAAARAVLAALPRVPEFPPPPATRSMS